MKVLSLTQPWASLVACGAKKIETRSWRCPAYLIGQRIAIHASKGFPRDAKDACLAYPFFSALWPDIKEYAADEKHPDGGYIQLRRGGVETLVSMDEIDRSVNTLPRGAILATARLTGCWSTNNEELVDRVPRPESLFGNYAPDRWMWGLDDVELPPEPIPAKGALGMWEWRHPDEASTLPTPLTGIYVDDLIGWGNKPAAGAERHFGNGKQSCHMSTDDHSPHGLEALHRFAERIGLKRAWYQDDDIMPHYDLTPSKRVLAVRRGAIEVRGTEIVALCGNNHIRELLKEDAA